MGTGVDVEVDVAVGAGVGEGVNTTVGVGTITTVGVGDAAEVGVAFSGPGMGIKSSNEPPQPSSHTTTPEIIAIAVMIARFANHLEP